jgi:RNA polymerase sigma-70 factor (ECF subfamily)
MTGEGMTSSVQAPAPIDFERLLIAMRPKLHRYCARMVGSVIDGEDVLQDALIKAVEAFPSAGPIGNPEGWLFRIAHNTALDFLRRRNRQAALHSEGEVEMIADQLDAVQAREIAGTSLRTFMRLSVAQRSGIILTDVLGCSLSEVCAIMDTSLPALKATLYRGRTQLREIATEPDDAPAPNLSEADRTRLETYVSRFNAHDFDAIRAMITDDIRLELVNKSRLNGRAEVARYFGNYSAKVDWRLAPALVEGRPAILVFDPDTADARPKYFMLLSWADDKVATIRDFRYAAYVLDGAEYREL